MTSEEKHCGNGGCGNGVSPLQNVATASPPSQNVEARNGGDAVATSPFFPGKDGLAGVTIGRGVALPHWSLGGAVYHICFRLADSVPQAKLEEWRSERAAFEARVKAGEILAEAEANAFRNLLSDKIERYLDSGYGECLLARPGVAEIFLDVVRKGEGDECRIHAYGIMPNHAHVLAEFKNPESLRRYLQVWKSASSHRINRLLGRTGTLWQTDYYNHIVRTAAEYVHQFRYVLGNKMVAAGGCGCGNGVSPLQNVATASPPSQDVTARNGGDAVATPGTRSNGGDAIATPRNTWVDKLRGNWYDTPQIRQQLSNLRE